MKTTSHRYNVIAGCADAIATRAALKNRVDVAHDARQIGVLMRFPSHLRPQDAVSLLWHYRAKIA